MHAHADSIFPDDGSRAEILGATPVLEILLIEDDPDLSALIMEYLDMESMRCDNAMTGTAGLDLALGSDGIGYDCIILDLNLPLLDGLSVCGELRRRGIMTPVIMLTARDRLEDKLEGFSHGTDDYLCKPFEMQELIARINVLANRRYKNSLLQCDSLIMDVAGRAVTRGGKRLSLSAIEWKLLHLLLSASPQPVSKQKLLFEVWGETPPDSDSLKVHIHNLRKAVDLPGEIPLLHTFPGHGYALCAKQ
ncbi:response regulator transcription factor [uncultured Desulfovibrio sp.]|uniref:response regulator transcription factor n=1 Tax=uncultured Desulfovibrio sp. TaxID=167968 RepID=UPI0028054EDD|nr:response regulator transcription factor [uncultured Desulfovibrio sp.]